MGKRKGRRPAAKSRSGAGGREPRPASEPEAGTEEEAEGESDLCFVCKDGGDLRLCDYRVAQMLYLQTAFMLSGKVDFSDKSTAEFLFKDYWEIIKEKEGLTLDNLQEAHASLDNSPNCNRVLYSENSPKEQSSDDDFLGNIDDDDDEPIHLSNGNGSSNKVKASRKKGKSKKNVYAGWGSKELIEFLASIGKDPSKSLDQFGAAEAVKEYIRQKDLSQKDKKKYIKCDGKLFPLFRKKEIRFTKIYSLLERHIAANATSEDETLASSEDNTDSFRKKKSRTMTSEPSTLNGISERYRRCFASLVRDNIKLIYLRRSLVMDLLKQPETFENKVIGCFVRVKNDPKYCTYHRPKTMYQLGQVTELDQFGMHIGASEEKAHCFKSCPEDKSKGANEKAVCLKSCSEEKSEGANERTVCFKSCSEENPKATEADACTPGTCVQNQAIAGSEDNAAGDRLEMDAQKKGTEGILFTILLFLW
ncbi:hypothetical protein ACQ4PT_050591 [Festuca glaucescens]